MSTAAMNAVDRTKAGAASGVLSMSRMVGGTVGLAVMGALVTTIGRSQLNTSLPQLPPAARSKIASALGSGSLPSGQHTDPHIVHAVQSAFVSALGTGLEVGAVMALIGAVMALWLIQKLPTQPQQQPVSEPLRQEAAPEAVPV
jgi:hypothetical protein